MTSDHDEMEGAVAAYVLDACDEREWEVVGAHVEGCPSCRDLARRLTGVVDVLAVAVDEVAPPAGLRERILAAASAPPGEREEPPAPGRIVPLPRRSVPGGWGRVALPALGAAVALLAVAVAGLAAWGIGLNRELNGAPSRHTLSGTGSMAGVNGSVTEYEPQGIVLVALSALPKPPPGRVYELWLVDSAGRALPDAVFTPDGRGNASLVLNRGLRDVKQVIVTEEAGPDGVQAPTRKPELAGQVGT